MQKSFGAQQKVNHLNPRHSQDSKVTFWWLDIFLVVFFTDYVLNELARALVAKGIPCQQKGYILRGKFRDASGFAKLSFELEVCRIPNLNVIGIRRKRLKGDAW